MGTTIKKRLAQSNIAMLVIPLLVAAALVLLGMGAAALLLAADGGVALPQRGERGDEQVPLDDPGPGLQPAGGSGVPHRAGRAPADEKGGMMTMGFMTPFHGCCMALADSVPGVSGGTAAFILGFYDHFIGALHDLFGRDGTARKIALHYLLKLGAGWVIGMGLCVSLLANLFSAHIYFMSSLFLGLTVVSIPFVALAEKAALRRRQNFPFALLGTALVVTLTILWGSTGPLTVNMAGLRLVDAAYLFLPGVVAITAMVLPGISGSSIAYHKTVFSHLQPGSRHS